MKVKVFDCFKFFNELELLELRFMELNDVVDYFVIVESNKTHTGKTKLFNFELNKKRFEEYLPKVIYVKVTDLPNYSPNDIWLAENFQRNCISRGLNGIAKEGDKIIVSDVDEIPNTELILKNIDNPNWVTFNQNLYYYYVNCQQNCTWDGPIMANYGTFMFPQQLRDAARRGVNSQRHGGWHYSFMGGPDRIKYKVENIAESSLIIDKVGNVSDINKKIKSHSDLWGRTEEYAQKKIVDISSDKPKKLDEFLIKFPDFKFIENER
jgi:beta-1,4-mannosyl-glycoprotein beta-1,4-N-acetylglucosaminyltransferase